MCPAISKKEQLFMADRFSSALLSPVNQEPVALESDAQKEKEKKSGKGKKIRWTWSAFTRGRAGVGKLSLSTR